MEKTRPNQANFSNLTPSLEYFSCLGKVKRIIHSDKIFPLSDLYGIQSLFDHTLSPKWNLYFFWQSPIKKKSIPWLTQKQNIRLSNQPAQSDPQPLPEVEADFLPGDLPVAETKSPLSDFILEVELAPENETIQLDLPSSTSVNDLETIETRDADIHRVQSGYEPLNFSTNESVGIGQPNRQPSGFNRQVPRGVLLVYGHDCVMKEEAVAVLEKFDFEIIFSSLSKEKTISRQWTEYEDVQFAVVILSADDFAYGRRQDASQGKLRTAQQVIFELGFLIGKLGRDHVFVLYEEQKDFELPTTFFDVLYTPFNKLGGWQFELLRQLKKIGYPVQAHQLVNR